MTPTSDQSICCAVVGAEKLPAGLGGESAVCAAITAAAAPALRQSGVSPSAVTITVQVKSNSWISALPEVNGKALYELKVASSDSSLNSRSIDMLATAVAAELSKLAQ